MRKGLLAMEEKICPYLNMTCQQICPAWLEELDDCVFHVCQTQVRDVFFQAAMYLDEKLDLPDGKGYDKLTELRKAISGNATAEDKLIVRSVINNFLADGILIKIQNLTMPELRSIFRTVEEVIHFDLGSLFSRPTEDEETEEEDSNEC